MSYFNRRDAVADVNVTVAAVATAAVVGLASGDR